MIKAKWFTKPPPEWGVALVLVVMIGLAFAPVWHADYINFDDPEYVFENPQVLGGITAAGVKWAFTTGHAANWHPLTWISHMVDVELYGREPRGHHLTNIGLHALATVLLCCWLRRATGSFWRSVFVAALFGLHPLRAESVAWISERKDVLCATFGFISLWAYTRYAQANSVGNGVVAPRGNFLRSPAYWLAVLALALGLMSKPMIVTWPLVMLLLDVWPLGRLQLKANGGRSGWLALVIEKIPFFVLVGFSSVITILVQRAGGTVQSVMVLPVAERVGNALISYWRYLGKIVWPDQLALYYPSTSAWPGSWVVLAGLGLVGITGLVVWRGEAKRYLCCGWGWYVITLIPVIGLVQVGGQAMADRYTYIPSIGLGIMLAWSLPVNGRRLPAVLATGAVLVVVVLGFLLYRQNGRWQDSETVFRHTIAVTPPNYMARYCLANALIEKGRTAAGLAELQECLKINPEFASAYGKLALVSSRQGNFAQAKHYYERTLKLKPDSPEALNNLAWLLATNPDAAIRDGAEAVRLAQRACALTQYQRTIYIGTLAAALAEVGRFSEAVEMGLRAQENALKWGETKLAEINGQLVELYRAGKPYHERQSSQN